jgi:hypothetical protein
MQELRQSLNNTIQDFLKLLPNNFDENSWRNLLPLDAIAVCPNDKEFDGYLDKWEKYLNSLDKLWNRMNAFVQEIDDEKQRNSIKGYLGNINNQRTTDELLVYFDQARNSVQHTLWRHLRPSAKQEIVSDGKGVTVSINNGVLEIQSKNGGTISEMSVFREGTVLLKEVKSKGEFHYLPDKHKDKFIYALDRVLPHMLGKFALMFYEETLFEMERRLKKMTDTISTYKR